MKDTKHRHTQNRRSERGNVFFTLFGAVAVVGVLGAGIMATMRGPLSTMVEVNRRTQAETQMQIASKLVLLESLTQANSGDCEAVPDGYIEPLPWVDASGAGPDGVAGSDGGGWLPATVGATKIDPWGTQYGYCIWDHGPTVDDANCGGAGQLRLAGTNAATEAAVVLISAGPDRTFQTSCQDDPNYVVKTAGADDVVFEYTYDDARGATGGLWNIKAGDPNVAEIDKEIEVAGDIDLDIGGTGAGQLRLGAASMLFPTQAELATCDAANESLLRVNTTGDPDTLEICNEDDGAPGTFAWESVAAGAPGSGLWADDGPESETYSSTRIGIGTNNPANTLMLDVAGDVGLTGDIEMNDTQSIIWGAGPISIAGDTDSFNVAGNTEITGDLDVTGAMDFIGDVVITGSTADNTADALTVRNNTPTPIFIVQNDGNVGIGNASPNDELDVAGTIDIEGDLKVDGNTILVTDGTNYANSIFLGNAAGNVAATGDDNTILGAGAGTAIDSGTNNTIIGSGAGVTAATGNNNIVIGSHDTTAVDVFAAGSTDYLNIGNVIFGDLANGRIGIGAGALPVDVSTYNDALEVTGSIDATTSINATTTLTAGTTITAGGAITSTGGNVVANGTVFINDTEDLEPINCNDTTQKLDWNGGWTCVTDQGSGGGSGGAQDLDDVLGEGNNGGNQDILNVSGIALGDATIAGGFILDADTGDITAGGLAIGSTVFTDGTGGGGELLEVDITGDIGATNYCDDAGLNCFTAASITGGGGGKWEDAAVANDIRYQSGDVGINVADPQQRLDVGGNVQASGVFLGSNGSAAAPSYAFTNSTGTGLYYDGANGLSISTNGGNAVNVLANNDVGIGTATVATGVGVDGQNLLMEVNGPVGATFFCDVDGEDCFQANEVGVEIWNPDGTNDYIEYDDTLGGVRIGKVTGQPAPETDWLLDVAGSVVYNTGMQVGIGTGTISDGSGGGGENLELDIAGDIGAVNYCDEDGLNCFVSTDVTGGGVPELSNIVAATADNTIANAAWNQVWNWQLTAAETGFTYGESAASTGGTTGAAGDQFILSASTVAASTAVPLHVLNAGAANSFQVYDAAADTTPFVIDEAGNVGIGTDNPADQLHLVGGEIRLDDVAANQAGCIRYNDTADELEYSDDCAAYTSFASLANNTDRIEDTGDQNTYIDTDTDDADGNNTIVMHTAGTERAIITAGGLVGLGDFTGGGDTVESTLHLQAGDIRLDGGAANQAGCFRFNDTSDELEFSDDCAAFTSINSLGNELWTDNTTYITRANVHVINAGQALPAVLDDDGTRFFFYPDIGAFRGGTIAGGNDAWQDLNIGLSSFAFGTNAQAQGASSVALGSNTTASNTNSVAMGSATIASGTNSVAMGSVATASGGESMAMGTSVTASGTNSVAMGNTSIASGSNSIVIGANSIASGSTSVAIGQQVVAGDGQFVAADPAQGSLNPTVGDSSVVIGLQTSAHATDPIVTGDRSMVLFFDANTVDANSAYDFTESDKFAIIGGEFQIDSDSSTAAKGCIRFNDTSDTLEFSHDCSSYSNFGNASSVAVSDITAATADNTIANAAHNQTWNWQLTAAETAFTYGESAASTGGTTGAAGDQFILGASTLATSTAVPLHVLNAGDANSFQVYDAAADTTPFVIDETGNVGIGTDNPADQLHLVGGEIRLDDVAANEAGCIRFNDTSDELEYSDDCSSYTSFASLINGNADRIEDTGDQNTYIDTDTDDADGNNTIVMHTAGTERVHITNTGDVGVGTGTPDARLHSEVDDASNTAVTSVVRLTHTTSGAPGNGIGVGMEFELETAAANNEIGAAIEAVMTDGTATSEDIDLVVRTMAAGTAAAERLRILSTGSVGIGDFSGDVIESALHIAAGDIRMDGGAANQAGCFRFNDATDLLEYSNDCSSFVTFDSLGAGGVALDGITAATADNTIANAAWNQVWNWQLTAAETAFTYGESAASTGGTTGAAGDQFILGASTLATSTAVPLHVLNAGDANSFQVFDAAGDTTPFVIDEAGNVGIGTAAPSNELDIDIAQNAGTTIRVANTDAGASASSGIVLVSDAGFTLLETTSTASATGGASILNGTGAGGLYIDAQNAAGGMFFRSGATPTERMQITPAGLLGLGDFTGGGDTVESTLHLQAGDIRLDGGAANEAGCIRFNDTSDELEFSDDCSSFTAINSLGGSPVLSDIVAATADNTIANAAHNQTWNWQLTAAETAFTYGESAASTGGTTGAAGDQFILSASTLATSTAVPLHVVNAGDANSFQVFDAAGDTTPFVIDEAGNVGIGKDNPGSRLDIEGSLAGVMPLYNRNTDTGAGSTSGLYLNVGATDATNNPAGYIIGGKEQLWTGVATTKDGYLAFNTLEDDAGGERVRITSSGNTGIGDFSSDVVDSALHIQAGDIRMDGGAANEAGCFRFNDATDLLEYSNDCSTFVTFDSLAAGGVALNGITAATADNTIANAAWNQTWNWQLTAAETGFMFGESAASTGGGAADQHILGASTLASSTAIPLFVDNRGNGVSFRVNDEATDGTPFIIDAAGNVGIGTTASGAKLHILAGTSDLIGIVNSTLSSSSTATDDIKGINNVPLMTTSVAHTGDMVGIDSLATAFTTGAGLTSTNLYGIRSGVSKSGVPTSTVTNAYDFYAVAPAAASGTITNAYGLFIEDVTAGGTSNYAIYADGTGLNVFEGNVGIGDFSPGTDTIESTLHIASGDIRLDGGAANQAGCLRFNDTSDQLEFSDDCSTFNSFTGLGGVNELDDLSDVITDYTAGVKNMYLGEAAGNASSPGLFNVALGVDALANLDGTCGVAEDCDGNTAVGFQAGEGITTGKHNTVVGRDAGAGINTGTENTFVGATAGNLNAGGLSNVAVGYRAGRSNTGNSNVYIGHLAGDVNAAGNQNVFVGRQAGESVTGGDDNILIGFNVQPPTATTSDYLNIGNIIAGDISSTEVGIGDFTSNTIDSAFHVLTGDIRLDGGAGNQAGCFRFNDTSDEMEYSDDCSTFTAFSSISGTPGGADTQVQFNDGGVFGGDAGMTYAKGSDILTVGELAATDRISLTEKTSIGTPTGMAMSNLDDADTTGVADGECLVYVNANGRWEPGACGSSGNTDRIEDTGDQNTYIDVDTDDADGNNTISMATAGTERVHITNAGAVGVGTGTPDVRLHAEIDDASNTAVTSVVRLTHTTSGVPGNGIGVGMEFELETAASNNEIGAAIEAVMTDGTATSEDIDLVVRTMAAGTAAAERLRILSTGSVGIGDFSGDVIESALHIASGDIRLDGGAANQAGCFRFNDTSDALEYSDDCSTFTAINSLGGGTPGGVDTQVQFNDGGAFGGDAGMTYAKATDTLTVAGTVDIGDTLIIQGQAANAPTVTIPGVISDLSDVDTTGVADGNCLVYVNANGRWEDGTCGGGGAQDRIEDTGDQNTYIDVDTDDADGNNTISMATAGTERMHISATGTVGLGTTTNRSLLTIYGDGTDRGTLGLENADTDIQTGNIIGEIYFRSNESSASAPVPTGDVVAKIHAVASGQHTGGTWPTDIVMSNLEMGGNTLVERMRIDDDGEMGIGDFSGDLIESTLHIQSGDIRLDGGAANQAGCFRFNDTSDEMEYSDDCSTFTALSGLGGLWSDSGSGYIEYTAALGGIKVAGVTGAAMPEGAIATTSGGGNTDRIEDTGNQDTYIDVDTDDADGNNTIVMHTAGTERVHVTNAGAVGVGTGTPDVRLHAEIDDATNNAVTSVVRLTHTTSGVPGNGIGVGMEFELETAASNNEIGAAIEAVMTDGTATSEDIDLVVRTMAAGTAAAERLRILSTGSVGIGDFSGDVIESALHLASGDIRLDGGAANQAGCIRFNDTSDELEYSDDCSTFTALNSIVGEDAVDFSGNLTFTASTITPTTWSQIGNDLNITNPTNPRLAGLNATTVAYIDQFNKDLRTYSFDGTDWSQVGNDLNISGVGNAALTALNSTTVAFIDNGNDELRTYSWDGTDWSQVGNGLSITVGNLNPPALTAMNSTTVAYIHGDADDLTTYSWDGTDWTQVGNALNNIPGVSGYVSLAALGATNKVAFYDEGNEDLRTYDWDGTDWTQVGNDLFIDIIGIGGGYLAALNANTVAFVETDAGELRSYTWNGTDWSLAGTNYNLGSLTQNGNGLATLSVNRIAFIDDGGGNQDLQTYENAGTTGASTIVDAGSTGALGALLSAGDRFRVSGTAGNDGIYTVSSMVDGNTITPVESITDEGPVAGEITIYDNLWLTDNTDVWRASGSVGIGDFTGADTIDSALHLASGDIRLDGGAANQAGCLRFDDTTDKMQFSHDCSAFTDMGGVSADSLDWSDFSDTMTLDASTTINMDTNTADLNFDANTFVIDSDVNRVGIGVAAPSVELDVAGTGAIKIPIGTDAQRPTAAAGLLRYNSEATPNDKIEYYDAEATAWTQLGGGGSSLWTAGAGDDIYYNTGVHNVGIGMTNPDTELDVDGNIEFTGRITDVSDIRLKTDIKPLNLRGSMMAKLDEIDTYSFVMKDDEEGITEFGVMAQEMEEVFPELVKTADDEMGTKSVNYMGLIAPMIEASKELKAENEALKEELADMKAERAEIHNAVADLSKQVELLNKAAGNNVSKASTEHWLYLLLGLFAGLSIVLVFTRRKIN